MKIDDVLFEFTDQRMRQVAALSIGLDLDDLCAAIAHAEAFMPITDPTRYRREMHALEAKRELATAMLKMQRKAIALGELMSQQREQVGT